MIDYQPAAMDEASGKVKSLYKALTLLDYFTVDKPELGVTELAQKSGLLKSTVSNMLATYEQCGMLEKNPETGKYHLGLKILALSNLIYRNNGLHRVSRPVLEEIADICRETIYLAKLYDKTQIIYMDSVFPRGNISGKSLIGLRVPAYCTGLGKALLAFAGPECIEATVNAGMPRCTPNTITTAQALEKELATIRERGYAIDNMEHEPDVRCIAMPITDSYGKVVAAISLSGPPARFTDAKIEEYAYIVKDQIGGLQRSLK